MDVSFADSKSCGLKDQPFQGLLRIPCAFRAGHGGAFILWLLMNGVFFRLGFITVLRLLKTSFKFFQHLGAVPELCGTISFHQSASCTPNFPSWLKLEVLGSLALA